MGITDTSVPDCPFCLGNNFFKGEILARTPHAYLARNEFSPGNYLINSEEHIEDPTQLPADWWENMNELLTKIPELKYDYNVSLNVGRQAGQTLKHLHFWVIPRIPGTPASGKGLARLMSEVNGS